MRGLSAHVMSLGLRRLWFAYIFLHVLVDYFVLDICDITWKMLSLCGSSFEPFVQQHLLVGYKLTNTNMGYQGSQSQPSAYSCLALD